MSLARAFTTRRAKQPSVDMGSSPQRSNTVSRSHGRTGSIRHKISAPVGLTHTTNMLAYNAPDLYPKSAASTSSSKSDDDSESDAATNASSPPTSPDVGTTPERAESPEPNHLSCYFMAPGQKSQPGQKLPYIPTAAPSIPKRAPSHTKKASMDNIAAQASTRYSNQSNNSFDTKASSVMSRTASISTTSTANSAISPSLKSPPPSVPATPTFSAPSSARSSSTSRRRTAERPEPAHPFGQELAQVSEIAEEFGIKDKIQISDEEQRELMAKGLQVFAPEVYVNEIQSLFASFFELEQPQSQPSSAPIWI